MKLRSGKILKYELPFQVEKKLNHTIANFKILLANNEDFAKELIQLIALADNFRTTRGAMVEMIDMVFGHNIDLLRESGSLLSLVTGINLVYRNYHIQPKYHDIIQEKMLEAFDMDISLTGVVDQYLN